ncbi:hypothetical protein RJ55_07341 [Drechmeria coniospora]|nr:hypothetical protein RJ55_07341 [Drechmeria coniospora]
MEAQDATVGTTRGLQGPDGAKDAKDRHASDSLTPVGASRVSLAPRWAALWRNSDVSVSPAWWEPCRRRSWAPPFRSSLEPLPFPSSTWASSAGEENESDRHSSVVPNHLRPMAAFSAATGRDAPPSFETPPCCSHAPSAIDLRRPRDPPGLHAVSRNRHDTRRPKRSDADPSLSPSEDAPSGSEPSKQPSTTTSRCHLGPELPKGRATDRNRSTPWLARLPLDNGTVIQRRTPRRVRISILCRR